jgi:hypothetical protein
MSDDLKNRGPADAKRVNIHETWELEYWSKKFGVTKEELKAAVARAGVMADEVRRALGK